MIDIYDYTDFRKFLRDRSKYLKTINQPISYRYIGEVAGFKSPGFFSQVLKGTCNLPDHFVPKSAEVFQLKKRESRYFALMVHYNQAENHDEKKRCFGRMVEFKKGRVRTIDPGAYAFYDKWYYSAIRAILNYYRFEGDYAKLSKMVVPNISVSEAKKAIRVLKELKLIEERDGVFYLTENHISTGPDTDSVVINNFVLNTQDIAKEALYRFDKKDRSFSSLTLSVSEKGYGYIKDKIDALREEIVEFVKTDSDMDRVVQLNFQLFPLTETSDSEEK